MTYLTKIFAAKSLPATDIVSARDGVDWSWSNDPDFEGQSYEAISDVPLPTSQLPPGRRRRKITAPDR